MTESNLETKLNRNQKVRAGVETAICLGAGLIGSYLINTSLNSESPVMPICLEIAGLGTYFSVKLAYEIGKYSFTGKQGSLMQDIEYPWKLI